MIRTIRDTTPTEAATITMHSAMFTRDVVENMEKKINEYEERLKLSNDEVNKLFVNNRKLKQQLQQATTVRGDELIVYHRPVHTEDPQIQQMKEEIDKLKKHNEEDVKNCIIEILSRILKHRVDILKDKINGVHEQFSNLIKALEQINTNSSILEKLQKKWQPTFHILTTHNRYS